jgi:cyclopropane fatty-acyl-phospholipid synthase-like methyltransferase
MKKNQIYNDYFFSRQEKGSYLSAKIIIPLILDYVKINSVVDFGCGLGTWLKVWQENGVLDILGIDGDYVNQDKLYIEKKYFKVFDLNKKISLEKKYDLAISLEVAEHIEKKNADTYIDNLRSSADIILFSAAIPKQADSKIGHINEQWPEYWQNKFSRKGFIMLDPLRAKIFNNSSVDWWYRQNIFLLIKKELQEKESFKNISVYNKDLKIIHQSIIDKL